MVPRWDAIPKVVSRQQKESQQAEIKTMKKYSIQQTSTLKKNSFKNLANIKIEKTLKIRKCFKYRGAFCLNILKVKQLTKNVTTFGYLILITFFFWQSLIWQSRNLTVNANEEKLRSDVNDAAFYCLMKKKNVFSF
jgi:hypothetical protein